MRNTGTICRIFGAIVKQPSTVKQLCDAAGSADGQVRTWVYSMIAQKLVVRDGYGKRAKHMGHWPVQYKWVGAC